MDEVGGHGGLCNEGSYQEQLSWEEEYGEDDENDENDDIFYQLDKICGKLAEHGIKISDLESQCKEYDELRPKLSEVRDFIDSLKEQLPKIQKEFSDLKSNHDPLKNDEEKQAIKQELELLRKMVKDLEKKNADLEIQLQQKCGEVKDLRERISTLEEEKTTLEERLCTLTSTVASLKDSEQRQIMKNNELEIKIRKVVESFQKRVEEELEATREKNKELTSEMEQLKRQQRYVDGGPLRLPVQASKEHDAMSRLSDLACVILSILYKIVLPDFHTSALKSSYTVERIERDIEKLPMSKEDREKAKDRWNSLKSDFRLTDEKYEVFSSIRESRNGQEIVEEHLEEQYLRESARFLEKENLLNGWLTMKHITELIEMWKKLSEKVKDED